MSWHYLLSQQPNFSADHESLLRQICTALGPGDVRLYAGDRGLLLRMNSSRGVRFKLKGKITAPWQKAFITIQVVLAKDDGAKLTRSLNQDSRRIMSGAKRMAHCLVELLMQQDGVALALRNAIELEGAINGEAWHEGEAALRQVSGIGASYAALLTKAGLGTLQRLKDAQPSQIEVAVRRNPPFGHQIQSACRSIPTLRLDCQSERDGDDGSVVLVRAQVEGAVGGGAVKGGAVGGSETKRDTVNESACYLLAILRSDDHQVLLHERISAGGANEHSISVQYGDNAQELTISLMCSSHAGVNIDKIIQVDARTDSQGQCLPPTPITPRTTDKAVGRSPVPNAPIVPTTVASSQTCEEQVARAAGSCGHLCKDKLKCRHSCCKTGAKRPRSRRRVDSKPRERPGPIERPKVQLGVIRTRVNEARAMRDLMRPFRFDPAAIATESSGPTSEIILPAADGADRGDALISYIHSLRA